VGFDQAKHRIRPAVPGLGHGRRDARVHRASEKGASANDACDRGHGQETAPCRVAWREHQGWSIADVVGGRDKHAVSLGMWIAVLLARVRAEAEVRASPRLAFTVKPKSCQYR
jgi:hypothetical protein